MLTWSCYAPAPYESAFSILNKLRLANAATLEEVAPALSLRLRSDSKAGGRYVRQLQRNGSMWNLARLSQLTGMPTRLLRKAFLQDLWFPLNVKGRDGVRFCPRCSALGYHNVFFDLAAIESCPWHGSILGSACAMCMSLLGSAAREMPDFMKMKLFTDGHYCFRTNPLPVWKFGLNLLLPEQQQQVRASCLALQRWQRRLARRLAERREVLELLQLVGVRATNLPRHADWDRQVRRAVELAGPCPWRLVTDRNQRVHTHTEFAQRK